MTRISLGQATRNGQVGDIYGTYEERTPFAQMKAFRNEMYREIPEARWFRKDELDSICIEQPTIAAAVAQLRGEDKILVLWRQPRSKTVAVCEVCGGKYRPAGGPCIHEHPQGVLRQSGPVCCLVCGISWYPGHACIAQPTAKDIRELAEMSSVLRLMDEIMERLADELGVAAPAAWEAV